MYRRVVNLWKTVTGGVIRIQSIKNFSENNSGRVAHDLLFLLFRNSFDVPCVDRWWAFLAVYYLAVICHIYQKFGGNL